jgi:adenosylcobinamide-phosphate synthase
VSLSAAYAVLADVILGEPPSTLHPTVWMGRWVDGSRRRVARRTPGARFTAGTAITVGGAGIVAALASRAGRFARTIPAPASAVFEGLALKPALAVRGLLMAGRVVEDALRAGDLPRARRLLSTHLVSRDTSDLSSSEVAGAAISSLAENLSDSVIAPLLAWRGAGLSGAYAYRFLNTADAMLGYRTAELEWLGKFAARSDDVVNLVPARLTALAIALVAPVGNGAVVRALRTAWRDAARTPSPNAGWPMASMAGALDVRLVKRGVYRLHDLGLRPDATSLGRARRIVLAAALLATGVVSIA